MRLSGWPAMENGLAVLLLYLTFTVLRKDEPTSTECRHQPGYLGSAKMPRACRSNLPRSVPFTHNSKRIPKRKGSAHHESSILPIPSLPLPHAIPYITAPDGVPIFRMLGAVLGVVRANSPLARRGWDDNMGRQIITPMSRSARLGFHITAALPFAEERPEWIPFTHDKLDPLRRIDENAGTGGHTESFPAGEYSFGSSVPVLLRRCVGSAEINTGGDDMNVDCAVGVRLFVIPGFWADGLGFACGVSH